MKKTIWAILICVIGLNIQAQDEYNPPKKAEEETQIRTSKDSIKIVNQEEKKDEDKSFKGNSEFRRNLRIGGGINLGSYTEGTTSRSWQIAVLGLSPQITYILSEYFEGGLSTSYLYQGTFGDINQHSLSAGPILRAYPFQNFFLQLEGIGFYTSYKAFGTSLYDKFDVNAFGGLGYISRLSETSYILTGIKMNIMKNALTNNQYVPMPFTSIHFGLWQ